MKRATFTILSALALTAGLWVGHATTPNTAQCVYCPSYTCFGANSCGTGCVCMKESGKTSGRCVSFE